MSLRFVTFVVVLLASAVVVGQGPRRDGRWEVRMQMEMPGMPANMPPMTMTQCVTEDEADNPEKMLPQAQGSAAGDKCTMADRKISGNKITWTMKCEGADAMSGAGEIVYSDNAYEGVMKMTQGGQTMTMKYSGKRLGDCTK